MSELSAVAYSDQNRAAEVLDTLRRLQVEHLLDLEDSCYVTWHTSLSHDAEARLRSALDAGRANEG